VDDWCLGLGVIVGAASGPVALALGVAVLVLFHRMSHAEAKLASLERALAARPSPALPPVEAPVAAAAEAPKPSEVPTEVVAPPTLPPPVEPPAAPPPPKPPAKPPFEWPSPERLVVWVGAAMGGLAVVLAALFALVAVIENGWIGPAARVALGLFGGSALWGGGAVQRRRWPAVASALAGSGIGVLYGTTYAATSVYGLLPASLGFAIMVGVTGLGTLRATVDRDRFVAWLALIGGILTPVLVSTGANRPYALFAYLALLSTGIAVAAARRSWPDLLLGAALGSIALHVGWSATWYTASQLPAALTGALLLTLPFAGASLSRVRPVRIAGALAAAVVPLVALAWMAPVHATFYDPRSGLTSVRAEPLAAVWTAVAMVLLPLPVQLAGRFHRSALQVVLGAPVALALGWVAAVGAAVAGVEPTGWLAVGAVGPAVVGALLGAGDPRSSAAIAASVAASGFVLTLATASVPPGALGLAVVALALAGAWVDRSARDGWVVGAALVGVGLPLATGSAALESPAALAGPALVALVLLVQPAVATRWSARAELAWGLAPFAAVAVFPALYQAWVDRLGDGLIGALPLLLAGYVGLAGVAVNRRGRLTAESAVVAAFALVTLLGLTAAVPLQLRERWLTVAWALEAAALAGISDRARHPLVRWTAVALCAAVGVRLLANPWALSWGTADEGWVLLNWTLYTWGVPLICVLLVARWLGRGRPDPVLAALRVPLWVLAALIGFALVNVEVSHAFQPRGVLDLWSANRAESMVRSASWAAYGLVVLGIGLARDQRVVRLVGFAFVLLATIKVFGVDLWDLRGFVRVGSIGCLGVSLLLAAVAFERLVLRSTRAKPEGGGVDLGGGGGER
jgi:uncharacterized membrane protein